MSDQPAIEALNEQIRQASMMIHAGQYDDAKLTIGTIPTSDVRVRSSLSGLLIDLGSGTDDSALVSGGVEYANEALGREKVPDRQASNHYNLANAYNFLYKKEWVDKTSSTTNSHIQSEKYHLREASRLCTRPNLLKQIYVNLANCLDHLNRGSEALTYYSKALQIDPKMRMAIGNRAMAMTKFADISGTYRQSIYFTAYDDLRRVVEQTGPIEYGGAEATKALQLAMQRIEGKFEPAALGVLRSRERVRHPLCDMRKMSNFERFYTRFCLDNRLYLNFHIHDERCEASMGDPIFIDHRSGTQSAGLANYINQIKEDYATARYILVRSQLPSKELSRISSEVVYATTPDRAVFNIYDGLLKTGFEEAYSILDKIAGFLNEFYRLDLNFKVYFTGNDRPKCFWEKEKGVLRPELTAKQSPPLFALYDIFKDFDSGYYSQLKNIRNGLAHRKLTVRRSKMNPAENGKPMEEIYVDDMRDATLELFEIVKSSVVYLINAVNYR